MKKSFFILLVCLLVLPNPAHAVGDAIEGIAVIVNDDVISRSDLNKRLRLALAATDLPENEDSMNRLRPQVLQALIDEKLQLQEAARAGVQVGDADIAEGLSRIAQQNGMTPEDFRASLESKSVNLRTLEDQVRAQVAWSQVIRRRLRPQVNISESDIDAEVSQIEANAGKPEYLVAEIFLGVTTPSEEPAVRSLAEELVQKMVGGAAFGEMAQKYSQSPGAQQGGNLGWIRPGQLESELDQALQTLQKGQVSTPLRTADGFHILFLRDQRVSQGLPGLIPPAAEMTQTSGGISRLILPLAENTNEVIVQAVAARAVRLSKSLDSCTAMHEEISKAKPESGSASGLMPERLSAEEVAALKDLPEGKPSAPVRTASGISVVMSCGALTPAPATPSTETTAAPPSREQLRDAIANRLGLERLDMLQRRYLNDLRATAYIDRRI